MKRVTIILGVLILLLLPVVSRADTDWNAVVAKKVTLFYPGLTSWEYLVGSDHMTGANAVIRGEKACQECHVKDDRIDIRADGILKGRLRMKNSKNAFEPEPPKGVPGSMEMEVQAAYDATDFYLRLKWSSAEGASYKDPSLDERGLSDRVAIQLNGNLRAFSKAGCFITCHNDEAHMPDSPSEGEVYKNPFYSNKKRNDVRLYSYFTRYRGWSSLKPEDEMERYLKAQAFIDLWVAGFKGQDVVVSDESVFFDRVKDPSQDINVQGSWQEGFYTVVIDRKLTTQDQSDIQLKEGKVFTIGLAVYDNKNGHRKHLVSFPLSISLGGGAADVYALKIIESQPPVK